MTTPSRAHLATALLSHEDEGFDEGELKGRVGSSAVLRPWRHLLQAEESGARAEGGDTAEELSGGGFGSRQEEDEGGMGSFGLSAGDTGANSTGSLALHRDTTFRTSSLDITSLSPHPQPRLDLSAEEEERLADEWGLSEVMSNAATDSENALRLGGGTGLARFPSTTRSEAGILTALPVQGGAAEEEDDVEVLETKSMPDLDRPRTISFADAVLEGLEQRLRNAPPARALSTTSGDDAGSTGTRVKILERTATQRLRARTTSLGPHAGMASLPSLSNLAGDGSVGDIASGRAGIATRDSLFQRPTSVYTTRASSIDALDSASAARPSMDGLSLVPSRLSLALPSDPSPAVDPPRPSTSLSTYTSRFDPLVIAAHRAQLAKDRPKFVNEEAGRPPKVVVMPAPLAGRAASPPGRKEWREGPDLDSSDEEAEGDEEEEVIGEQEEEVPEGLKEPLHPAGALYGRSLMDVIAERKAILKAQQRAYVPGSDGRKSMFEWKDGMALERQQDEKEEENLPIAFVPGGQATLAAKNQARAAKVKSIFGPDLVYQRELAQMRELEEVERAEREERERAEEERRVREEARRRKGKLRKGGKRRKGEVEVVRQEMPRVQEAVEWQPETDVAVEEPVDFAPPASPVHDVPPVEPPSSRRTVAPSISGAFGVSQAAGASDWFEEVLAHPSATKEAGDAASDDDDEDLYKPRPVSSLASYRRPSSAAAFDTRRNTFLSSDSSASDAESEDLDDLASPVDRVPSGTNDATRHLPFPGEPSSNGHDSVSLAETQDDVPLGVRYSRQAMALPQIKPTGLGDLARLIPQEQLQEGAEDPEDEDDAPLGARFSRMMPPTDDGDDLPLAIRRIALAPSAVFAPRPPTQPFASIRPIGDDGKTVASDDSDELPLGLKTAPTAPFAQQPAPYSFPHTMPYTAPGAPFPYSTSRFFPPPLAPTFAPAVAPPLPPNPHAQLALAQMQMQAAMQQQAVLAEGGSIERWRREISG